MNCFWFICWCADLCFEIVSVLQRLIFCSVFMRFWAVVILSLGRSIIKLFSVHNRRNDVFCLCVLLRVGNGRLDTLKFLWKCHGSWGPNCAVQACQNIPPLPEDHLFRFLSDKEKEQFEFRCNEHYRYMSCLRFLHDEQAPMPVEVCNVLFDGCVAHACTKCLSKKNFVSNVVDQFEQHTSWSMDLVRALFFIFFLDAAKLTFVLTPFVI